VKPHISDIHIPFRDDQIKPGLPLEKAILNAPEKDDQFFIVPGAIDASGKSS